MREKIKKCSRDDCWIKKYIFVFLFVCLAVYSLQIYYGKSFIYTGKGLDEDGLVQHYNALAYYDKPFFFHS